MYAEFTVKSCFDLPGLGVVISGEVMDGSIAEGVQGKTSKGKICTVVRIDSHGQKLNIVSRKDKVSLTVKNITITDVKPGEALYFF
jgi:selenocysteine-specific translation elongation factor